MGKFRNELTNVVVSVDDSKDGRFAEGWVSADAKPAVVAARPKKSGDK